MILFVYRERREQEVREIEKQHKEREKERERMERERLQEREKMEREREKQIERDRIDREQERERQEKQRAAEQAVHKHFEESLRLAHQKVKLNVIIIPFYYSLLILSSSFSAFYSLASFQLN